MLISYAWFKVIKRCLVQVDFERVGYNNLGKQESIPQIENVLNIMFIYKFTYCG